MASPFATHFSMVLEFISKTNLFIEQRNLYQDQYKNKKSLLLMRLQENQKVTWEMKKSCKLCFKTFTLVHRRHHCRLCGSSICDECTIYYKDKKCCTTCFKIVNTTAITVEDPMRPLFDAIESLKRQLLEILPYFNGLIMEIKSSIGDEQLQLHKQASILRNQLSSILQSIQMNINQLKAIEAIGDYKICINNYIKSIQLFLQSFTATFRSFK